MKLRLSSSRRLADSRVAGPRRGVAAVEMAFLLPVLALLIVGVWEVGRMVEVQQILGNAAREGARQASTGSKSASGVQDTVVRYLQQNGISKVYTTDVVIVNKTNASRTDPMTATQMDQWQVTVTLPFDRIRWAFVNQITTTSNLVGSADWVSTRDVPLVVNSAIPLN